MSGEATIGLDVRMRAFARVGKSGAKDADGDGINEVHTNTVEGMWTTVRNFLRPLAWSS